MAPGICEIQARPRVLAEFDRWVNNGQLFLFALRPDQLQRLATVVQEHVADDAVPERIHHGGCIVAQPMGDGK